MVTGQRYPGPIDDRRVRLAHQINSVAVHLLRRISRDDAADGLTSARLSALSVLVFGGATTLGRLARIERVAAPTMTRLVDGLVADGLVGRVPDPADGRRTTIVPTDLGRELVERGRARRIRRLAAELTVLDEDELEALARGLDVLARIPRAAGPLRAGTPGPPTSEVPR
jgi:DNA-binding MarR family transcriptional regulator